MIASERRIVTEGESCHSLKTKLALSGRPVKIYVIDPKKFQEQLKKYVPASDEKPKKTGRTSPLVKEDDSDVEIVEESKYSSTTVKTRSYPIPIAPKEPQPQQIQHQVPMVPQMTTIILPPNTNFLSPFPVMTFQPTVLTSPAPVQTQNLTPETPKKSQKPKKKAVKRKAPAQNAEAIQRKSVSDEQSEAAELVYLLKENTTTRTGRVSKSIAISKVTSPCNSQPPSPVVVVAEKQVTTKKPSEQFRCLTCRKFYVGNARFNQHFEKFPDHVKPDPVEVPEENIVKKKAKRQKAKSKSCSKKQSFHHLENIDEETRGGFSPLMRTKASDIHAETLSDNCTSPANFTISPVSKQSDENQQYFVEFQQPTFTSLGESSFNSLENLLAENSSAANNTLVSSSPIAGDEQHQQLLPPPPEENFNNNMPNKRRSSFFSNGQIRNSESSSLSYNKVIPVPSPPLVVVSSGDEESRESEKNNSTTQIASNPNSNNIPKRKSIWEFVKEQIRNCGINQTCGEISEMAEKLSKIARDKFYPIQDEEVERLGNASPVIQVDTPFISHLLDLPFGHYLFKEDGGIRKVLPPPTPVPTELSLTNGVEVDVDKFLTPDLISLPHLTNIDFTSICNN